MQSNINTCIPLINRLLYKNIESWKNKPDRKPLILRGARQVGKTTLVRQFGSEYQQFLYFNLEDTIDRILFEDIEFIDSTLTKIFLERSQNDPRTSRTLMFIDEVQEVPKVIEMLRFFYERHNYLDVIVSGSLLDFALQKIERTPVGRVEYMELHPISFIEFLQAKNINAAELLSTVPLPDIYHSSMLKYFHEYSLIGGMPNIVSKYIQENDIIKLQEGYAAIIEAYRNDIEKYARNNAQQRILRHIIQAIPFEIENRINLNNFGDSNYKTREIKEAMISLEKARIIELIYPTTHTRPPILFDLKKRPRLTYLDFGLINYQLGIQSDLLTISDLNDVTRGKLAQQIVYQELKSIQYLPGRKLGYWVRDQRGSSSEVDIVYQYKSLLIPIEIKSGAIGRLRSLHEYMDQCEHKYAIRLYSGALTINTLTSRNDKSYYLLNLPYFLTSQIKEYIEWFIERCADMD